MKITQFLAITTLLIAVLGCSKQDNQEAIGTPVVNTPAAAEKPMEVMPSATEVKPAQMLPNEIKADDTTTVIEQDDSGRKVIYWYDPMLEDRHFSKSGQSPFMDMKLAPQYAAEEVNKGSQP
ncbi:MAG TPA: heavy metal-binding domain-containing protein [Methylotenera sp.]|nr:heavy metal-binding domain-containing protein [Methylotenera sp.]